MSAHRQPPLIPLTFEDVCEFRIPLRDRTGLAIAWARCDPEDYDDLSRFKWHRSGGYARRTISKNKHERMHSYLMPGVYVDHINRDKLDNRRSNLRVCTHAENLQNHPGQSGKTSAYRGVSWHAGAQKWEAGYMLNWKKVYLGLFESEEEAARVVSEARRAAMPFTVEPPPFRAARCTCGHVEGDHHSAGTGWPHPPRYGYCYVKGCDCREYRERNEARAA